jgi:hypothetical protein
MILFRETNGEPVEIDPRLQIGAGGEARIYALPDAGELVAKVYHRPTEERARKLIAMLADPPVDPTAGQGHASIAWPTDLLREGEKPFRVAGYLMPRAEAALPVMDYYNPAARRVACPLFSYQYLLRTARNLAAVVAALHARDYVIGDVNEANILVTATALVTVVDTDSFQVRDRRHDTVYRCPVARPEFTPAELQGKLLQQVDRSPEHDRFGLAVLLFLLLMEGTHPFAGIYAGEGDPPSYEARIAAGHFPYGTRPTPYRPLPLAPPVSLLPMQLYQLFGRCFQEGHEDPAARPDAQTWAQALRDAEENLATCSINPQHRYGKHLFECPWCARTLRLGGRDPFPARMVVETGQHLQAVAAVQTPLPTAVSPRPESVTLPTRPGGHGSGELSPALVGVADAPLRLVESKAPDSAPPIRRAVNAAVPSHSVIARPQPRSARRTLPLGALLAFGGLAAALIGAGLLAQRAANAPTHSPVVSPSASRTKPQPDVPTPPPVSPAERAAATPQKLQRAIVDGDSAKVQALLAANPGLVHEAGKAGWTPLHYAAYAGKETIASDLIAAGADVNAQNADGFTPLHLAAQEGRVAVAGALIAHGADLNAQEKQGWTPLHFAAQEGHAEVARLLIDRGADVNRREHAGLTPLAVATKEKMSAVADLLRQHGGQ